MALKFKFKSKDEVPAEHLSLYTERDGAWLLDVEGAVEKAKLDEFRTSNVALLKERDELKQRFDGIDPDEVRSLRTASACARPPSAAEEAQLKAGEVEKVLEARAKALKGEFDKQLSTVTTERDALNARLVAIQIDQGVITAASKRGLRASAMPDITARARGAFRLVNGVPTAFEADGQTVRAGKDGVAPMTLEEWVDAPRRRQWAPCSESALSPVRPSSLSSLTSVATRCPHFSRPPVRVWLSKGRPAFFG